MHLRYHQTATIPENVFSLDLCMEGEPGQRQVLYAPLGVYYFALESGFTSTQLRCTTSPTLLLWGLYTVHFINI